jgi:hypothetical protein
MSGQGKGPRVAASDAPAPAWLGEFRDEVRVLISKYERVGGRENAGIGEVRWGVMCNLLGIAAGLTPPRCERSAVEALGMLFDDYRPGWRRSP